MKNIINYFFGGVYSDGGSVAVLQRNHHLVDGQQEHL